jgi:hypothetical protein
MADYCDGAITLYAVSPENQALREHIAAGKRAATIQDSQVTLILGEERLEVFSLDVLTPDLRKSSQILETLLAAAAAAWVSDIPAEQIRSGLTTFAY